MSRANQVSLAPVALASRFFTTEPLVKQYPILVIIKFWFYTNFYMKRSQLSLFSVSACYSTSMLFHLHVISLLFHLYSCIESESHSVLSNSLVPWTVAHQGPLSMEFSRVLEWVAISFSRTCSWPRDWTRVSCLAGRFFTIWATREALVLISFAFSPIISLFNFTTLI